MSNSDWIPGNIEKFQEFAERFVLYVRSMAPEWTHIPTEVVTDLFDSYEMFHITYKEAIKINSTTNIRRRTREMTSLKHKIRDVTNRYLRFLPVTDMDRDNMKIPNHDGNRTNHLVVTQMVDSFLKIRRVNEIVIEFKDPESSSKARPRNTTGCYIKYCISETEPASIDDYNKEVIATRTPCAIKFDTHDSGKRVWFRMAWMNARGVLGDFSEAQSCIIP